MQEEELDTKSSKKPGKNGWGYGLQLFTGIALIMAHVIEDAPCTALGGSLGLARLAPVGSGCPYTWGNCLSFYLTMMMMMIIIIIITANPRNR
jgi:hypothetical protein